MERGGGSSLGVCGVHPHAETSLLSVSGCGSSTRPPVAACVSFVCPHITQHCFCLVSADGACGVFGSVCGSAPQGTKKMSYAAFCEALAAVAAAKQVPYDTLVDQVLACQGPARNAATGSIVDAVRQNDTDVCA